MRATAERYARGIYLHEGGKLRRHDDWLKREPNFKKLPVSGSGVDTQKMCGVSNYRCAVTGISVVADTAVT